MDRALLIDALVRRTADLVADLAIEGATNHSLGHINDLFFQAMDARLRSTHGKPQRVIADIFRLPLRTLQHRLQTAADNLTVRDRTVWRAIYGHIQAQGPLDRSAIECRFVGERPHLIRSILNNMVSAGVVFAAGRGAKTLYQVNQRVRFASDDSVEADARLVWVATYNRPDASLVELAADLGVDGSPLQRRRLERALDWLLAQGALTARVDESGTTRYRGGDFVMPRYAAPVADAQAAQSWMHAALYDHFSVVVDAMCAKLRHDREGTRPPAPTGGATYRFDLLSDDETAAAVTALLERMRRECTDLRETVDARSGDTASTGRVIFYFGQTMESRPNGPLRDG